MAVEIAIWRMTDAGPHKLVSSPLDFEQRLEDMLSEDPSMSGMDLLIPRQKGIRASITPPRPPTHARSGLGVCLVGGG